MPTRRADLTGVVPPAAALPVQHLRRVLGACGVNRAHGMPALTVRAVQFIAGMERRVYRREITHAHTRMFRVAADSRGQRLRSPRSPCPFLAVVLAFLGRSRDSDLLTSSDSPNRPPALRRTYRLSLPVLISSRFAAVRFRAAIITPNCALPCNAGAQGATKSSTGARRELEGVCGAERIQGEAVGHRPPATRGSDRSR